MKKLFSAFIIATLVSIVPSNINANCNPSNMIDCPELFQIEATAYCNPNGNLTCTGRPTTEGLTIATCKEWLGCTIYVWTIGENGEYEFYGIFEAMDTGGNEKLKNGTAVDIYMSSRSEALEWGRRKVMVQVVRSVG